MANRPRTGVGTFHLDAPIAQVFPLFTALGERAWARDWDPYMLSGCEGRGSAFRTVRGDCETTWIVIEYQPGEGRLGYARLAQDSNIGLVDVHCSPSADGGTAVSVCYTLTGVNARGRRFVEQFLEPRRYGRMIEQWHSVLRALLAARK